MACVMLGSIYADSFLEINHERESKGMRFMLLEFTQSLFQTESRDIVPLAIVALRSDNTVYRKEHLAVQKVNVCTPSRYKYTRSGEKVASLLIMTDEVSVATF